MVAGLLQPEHVVDQWQQDQRDGTAPQPQQQFTIPAQQVQFGVLSLRGEPPPLPHTKQPSGQVPQFKFALTSAFLDKASAAIQARP